jgi:ribonuclease HI
LSEKIIIYTDGACSGNPGAGGWGALLVAGSAQKEIYGGEPLTTNNRMELSAVIRALEAIRPAHADITVVTDSTYVRDGITKWLDGWKRNGWRTNARKPLKNPDLWRRLDELAARHAITWEWVRGHSGHPENERVDALARRGVEENRQKP